MRLGRFGGVVLSLALAAGGCHRGMTVGGDGGRQVGDGDMVAADGAVSADTPAAPPEAGEVADSAGTDGAPDECRAQITFHIAAGAGVDPTTLCLDSCGGVSVVMTSGSVQFGVGPFLAVGIRALWSPVPSDLGCVVMCDGCTPLVCPHCVAGGSLPPDGMNQVWEGAFFPDDGMCNGTTCVGTERCAPTGHYRAEFCVPSGMNIDGRCILPTLLDDAASRTTVCGTAEFELPSTSTLAVALGGADGGRGTDGGGRSADLVGLPGDYRAQASSGGITDATGIDPIRFDSVPLTIVLGSDSDLLVTTNPLPLEFPGTCSLPMNAANDATGRLVLENLATTCSSGGATISLAKGSYKLTVLASTGKLRLSSFGTITGGMRDSGLLGFAYSGEVAPAL